MAVAYGFPRRLSAEPPCLRARGRQRLQHDDDTGGEEENEDDEDDVGDSQGEGEGEEESAQPLAAYAFEDGGALVAGGVLALLTRRTFCLYAQEVRSRRSGIDCEVVKDSLR